jgi:hypothetical protein
LYKTPLYRNEPVIYYVYNVHYNWYIATILWPSSICSLLDTMDHGGMTSLLFLWGCDEILHFMCLWLSFRNEIHFLTCIHHLVFLLGTLGYCCVRCYVNK